MTSFLDSLEHELVAAVQRRSAGASDAARTTRTPRHIPARLLLAAALLALLLAAAALAATGVLFTGASIPTPPHPSARAGVGIPAPGRSRLIARSVPDPSGGPRWSMRIVRTSRGLVCLQVGRLHEGEIGVIGEDGAFHDDGLFHPMPSGLLSQMPGRFATFCEPRGVSSEYDVLSMPASGQMAIGATLHRLSQERSLHFGLLGRSAVSITYRTDSGIRHVPVERGTGAYLIVLPAHTVRKAEQFGATKGFPNTDEGRIRAEPPITEITYVVKGSLCEEGYVAPVGPHPCPRVSPSSAETRRRLRELEHPRDLHVPIHIRLQGTRDGGPDQPRRPGGPSLPPPGADKGVYYNAEISFRAPFPVNNADGGYRLAIGGSKQRIGGISSEIERDVREGEVVHVKSSDLFANTHGRPVSVAIVYYDILSRQNSYVLVGSSTVAEP